MSVQRVKYTAVTVGRRRVGVHLSDRQKFGFQKLYKLYFFTPSPAGNVPAVTQRAVSSFHG